MVEKPHIDIVFIGHVDHGKSTLVGRLLLDSEQVRQETIDKYREKATMLGKATFELAWVMDDLKEERKRGLTIRSQIKDFKTQKHFFTIIDAPGHKDFVKNMILGTRQADAAILVVAAPEGVQAQTKEHVYLAKTLGIGQIIVAVNKMDSTIPEFSEGRYNQVKSEASRLMEQVGYKEDDFSFVPVSAYHGDNVFKSSNRIPWYKGLTLYESLDTIRVSERPTGQPFRLPVQHIFNVPGIGYIPVGKVETGTVKPGDVIKFMPVNVKAEVRSIEMHRKQIEIAGPGDSIGMSLRVIGNWSVKRDLRRGYVAGSEDNPPTVAESFLAKATIFNHPSQIWPGYRPVIHCHTASVACELLEINAKLDPLTGETVDEKPQFLKNGNTGIVRFRPMRPLVIEKATQFPRLGRFAIRDMGQTIGAGIVAEIDEKRF